MSSEPAVTARGISKIYKLGLTGRSDTLLKVIERRARHPIRGTRVSVAERWRHIKITYTTRAKQNATDRGGDQITHYSQRPVVIFVP